MQEEDDGQRYQWVLEFQCIDNDQGDVLFIGINFYSRSNTTRDLSQVGAVAAYGPFSLRRRFQVTQMTPAFLVIGWCSVLVSYQMLTSARSHKLGSYLDAVRPYHLVNHTDCVYEPPVEGGGETSRTITETS